MGNAAAKAIRADDVVKGSLRGDEKKCVAFETVTTKKVEAEMKDVARGSWAFRAGNAEIVDDKGNVLYKTESYSTNDRMFSVKCLSGLTGQTLCVGVCKDVTGGDKTQVRILRPEVQAYKGQSDFAVWARENRGTPLYPFAMIEIKRDEKGPVATYTVTIADEIGDPKPLPLYVARVYGDIASMSRYLMAVETADDNAKLVAKIDQPSGFDSKRLTVEVAEGVDMCAVMMLSLFFGVTKGMIW